MSYIENPKTKGSGVPCVGCSCRKPAMTFQEYAVRAKQTESWNYDRPVEYLVIALAGEVGEICNKLKKRLRGDLEPDVKALLDECGDVLWYLDRLTAELGSNLEAVAGGSLEKVESRKRRGMLFGFGDKR